MDIGQQKLSFLRYEFKYILSQALREAIEDEIKKFMILDPFVADTPKQTYKVRSLYFDDISYTNYHDKMDGIKNREKFRVRTYTSTHAKKSETFLEIKGRYNALTYKQRTPLTFSNTELVDLSQYGTIATILSSARHGYVYDKFTRGLGSTIRPIMVIDYVRRPYHYKFDPDFRITFDYNLIAKTGSTLHSRVRRSHRSILKGYTIMEIKFTHGLPLWFANIIERYQLQRLSISKITAGMNVWEVTPEVQE